MLKCIIFIMKFFNKQVFYLMFYNRELLWKYGKFFKIFLLNRIQVLFNFCVKVEIEYLNLILFVCLVCFIFIWVIRKFDIL